MKKLTKEDFILRSSILHKEKYDYSFVEYIGNATPVKISCPDHGIFEQRPLHHLRGAGCPKCSSVARMTTKDFIERSIQSRGGSSPYDYSKSIYVNNLTKIIVTCPIHGDFLQNVKDHYSNKSNCPKCSIEKNKVKKRKTIDSFIIEASSIHCNKYDYSKFEYINSKEKSIITCPIHGDFEQTPNAHLKGRGCPKCGILSAAPKLSRIQKSRKFNNLSQENFILKIKKIHNDEISIVGSICNTLTKIEVNCPVHGSFFATPNNLLYSKSGCPMCANSGISKQEMEIVEYIKTFYSGEVIRSYRPEWMGGKELDIYIPEFNVAIEVNGSYWHSEEKKNKWYHFDKTLECQKNGVILLHIWEHYWKSSLKRLIYESKISHLLKADKKVFARKCTILNIDKNTAIEFVRKNHLEGFGIPYKNSKYIGLFSDQKILMVAIYGEFYNQTHKIFEWKLQRVCTLLGYTVVGGISKINKYIKNDVGNFIFQVTLDTGGTIVNGKIERKNVTLRYWWIKGGIVLSRNHTQVSKLKNNSDWLDSDTEDSYLLRLGFIRIWDSGITSIMPY